MSVENRCSNSTFLKIYQRPKFISVQEVNVAFLPVEERVFSLENKASYADYFSDRGGGEKREEKLDQIAEQLVSIL